ncbi:hypothetical protein ASPVEDRAFT_79906 [Aspergillus versicolor CBS 583.65]|uniref:DUF1962 domain-containing protein n=1 Tax=Aspergillus versicolor CBS 583.65 TaxID=1036611 RepID=A0A1L9P9N0_ASPVE|nr:uncharacterized protein ASPVEDRAFT_79906 [Aspergillus versicolor CBS 583.65]OJI98240.1 hypothetical protein ASPVEDRAFT_79906 [Aspergillus versicolor CBS 583.65]
MKFTSLILTLMAAAAVTAAPSPELEVRDTCGPGYGGDQRRTNSPCNASNGDRHFCGCDRTGVVECRGGRWTEIRDCGRGTCHGGNDGGAVC